MKRKSCAVIVAAVMMAAAAAVFAGGGPQSRSSTGLPTGSVEVRGRIAHVERLGGYIIRVDPVGEMMIANPVPDVLQPLAASGRVLGIRGRFTVGADHFRIEAVDGTPYPGIATPR